MAFHEHLISVNTKMDCPLVFRLVIAMFDLQMPKHSPSKERVVSTCAMERMRQPPPHLRNQPERGKGSDDEILCKGLVHIMPPSSLRSNCYENLTI